MTFSYEQLAVVGGFIGGIWALSLITLNVILKNEPEPKLKEAAQISIVAISIIGGAAAAFAAGATAFEVGGWQISGLLGVFMFLVPFFAGSATVYWIRPCMAKRAAAKAKAKAEAEAEAEAEAKAALKS